MRSDRPSSSDEAGGENPLERVLDEYLQRLADGEDPDQEEYLRSHPELADTLRGVFRTLDFVESSAGSPSPPELAKGRRIGDFRIEREIARGGMGIVYEAIQESLDRRVALKILPAGALFSGNALERFHREASTVARLHHTNIVPVFAVGEEQGVHYFAMQFIEGSPLSELLKNMRRDELLPGAEHFRRVAAWGRQVADALAYAHEKGTIHRDVKPSNLLLDAEDGVWVTDFGLARSSAKATITATGDILGTARYMSPEQAGGRGGIDERTDLYSLGATLYELLVLSPAVEGESRDEVLVRIAVEEPLPLRRRNRAVPRDLETIVGKCLQKDPDERYAGAAEVAEDLRRFLAGEPIRARRPPLWIVAWRLVRRHQGMLGAAAVILVLIAIAVALYLQRRSTEGHQRIDAAFNQIFFDRDIARASELLDEAESLGIDSVELHLHRGLLYLTDLRAEEAAPHLAEALRLDPEHIEARLAMAMAATYGGDYAGGIEMIDQIPQAEIDTALGWLLRGDTLSASQHSSALESYDRAIGLRSDFVPAIAARARYRGYRLLTEQRVEDLELMLDDCRALTIFRPNSSRAFAVQGHGWLAAAAFAATREEYRSERDRWLENARLNLEAAVSHGRDDPHAHERLGTYYRYVGDFATAERTFAAAAEADQKNPQGGNYRIAYKHAATLWALGELERALETIERAEERGTGFYPFDLLRSILLAELGRTDEALAPCLKIRAERAQHANAQLLAIATMEFVGHREEARSAITEIARGDGEPFTSEDAEGAYFRLGVSYLSGATTVDELLEATEERPGLRCELLFLVGLTRLGRGDREAGLEALRICCNTQVFRFFEHRCAQILLHRSATSPGWPSWQ